MLLLVFLSACTCVSQDSEEVSHHSKVFTGSWLDVGHTHIHTHTRKKLSTPVWGSLSPLCLFTLGSMTVIWSKRLYKDWLGEADASCKGLSWQRREVCVCMWLCLSVCGRQAEVGRWNCLSDRVTECTFWPCVSALTSNGEASDAGTRTTDRQESRWKQTDKKSKHEAKNTWGDWEFVCERAKDRREQTLVSISAQCDRDLRV